MLNKMLSRVSSIALDLGHKVVFQSTNRLTIVTETSKLDVWFEDSSYHVFANSNATDLVTEIRGVKRDSLEHAVQFLLWGVK